ncbi:MAG: transposase [Chloroflexota bacterium]
MPSGRERTISRFYDLELIDEAEERITSTLGRQFLREWRVRSEGAFALAKELHGLRRTRFVGRRKVQIQLWLTDAAMNPAQGRVNIKKSVRMLRRLPPTAARATVGGVLSSDPGRLLMLLRKATASVHHS